MVKRFKKEEYFQAAISVLAVNKDALSLVEFEGQPRTSKTKSSLKLVKPSKLLLREKDDIVESFSEVQKEEENKSRPRGRTPETPKQKI